MRIFNLVLLVLSGDVKFSDSQITGADISK